MNQEHKIVLYQVEDTNIYVNVMFKEDTFWMTQKALADLFECTTDNISLHLKNIYKEEELDENRTTEFFSVVQNEGQRNVKRKVKCYNLDAIIAVGYRVNSKKATRFRQWATKTLKEYITKGFVLNDDMLKNGRPFGKDYFDELLERIREIRASERRAYQKITDVFEQCSYDYDKNSEITKAFYAFVQNKLHFAVTGKTAAELIYERADSEKPAMGLTTWKDSPDGKILKRDIGIAKNYLNEKELSRLNRLVTMFIDYAELMAEDEIYTLPQTTPLLPLYEAIINSIQSIEDAQISNGKIEIIVERDKQMNLFNQWETDIELLCWWAYPRCCENGRCLAAP